MKSCNNNPFQRCYWKLPPGLLRSSLRSCFINGKRNLSFFKIVLGHLNSNLKVKKNTSFVLHLYSDICPSIYQLDSWLSGEMSPGRLLLYNSQIFMRCFPSYLQKKFVTSEEPEYLILTQTAAQWVIGEPLQSVVYLVFNRNLHKYMSHKVDLEVMMG